MVKYLKPTVSLLLPLLWIAIGIFIIRSIYDLLLDVPLENIEKILLGSGYSLVLAILLYMFSHFLRAIRLLVMSSEYNMTLRFRYLLLDQLKANTVNLALPFKLGESYRIFRFKSHFGTYFDSFNFLVIERLFDFLTLFLLIAYGVSTTVLSFEDYSEYIQIIGGISFLLVLFAFALGDILILIHRHFLARPVNSRNNMIILVTGKLAKSYYNIFRVVKEKAVVLVLISILIWIFEFGVLAVLFSFDNLGVGFICLLGVSIALSGLLPNGPMGIGGVQLAFIVIYSLVEVDTQTAIGESYIYSLIIFGSGLIIGSILFLSSNIKSRKWIGKRHK